MTHEHTRELFAKTTQAATFYQAPLSSSELNIGADRRAKTVRPMKTVHKASVVSILFGYAALLFVLLWLLYAVRQRVFGSAHRISLLFERTCVEMNRHKVQPFTPAVDSAPGGKMEPFAFGSLTFDAQNGEVSWKISDSLGIEAHDLAIHGPLSNNESYVAPVFISLGLQRNGMLQLAGATSVQIAKIREIQENPKAYYIAARERLVSGKVREIARDTLDKKCAPGVP